MTEPCKTVPVEPTHKLVPFAATLEMEAAARKFVAPYHDLQDYEVSAKVPKDLFRLAWTAMIAAAPEPPRVSVEEVAAIIDSEAMAVSDKEIRFLGGSHRELIIERKEDALEKARSILAPLDQGNQGLSDPGSAIVAMLLILESYPNQAMMLRPEERQLLSQTIRFQLATLTNHEEMIPMLINTTAKHFDRVKSLEAVVGRAALKFREYEELHYAKGTPEATAKALVNGQIADILEAALAAPILTPEEVAARQAFEPKEEIKGINKICDCGVFKGSLKTVTGCGCLPA